MTAECSERSVTTVRQVLAIAELAVEIYRGTGNAKSPRSAWRPSVWHLVSRRRPVDNSQFCDLPSLSSVSGSVLLELTTQEAPLRAAPGHLDQPKPRKRRRAAPLPPIPIDVHKLAAEFIATSVGFPPARDGVHTTGQVARALLNSHLQLDAWTAESLKEALEQQMQDRHMYWPDHISNPGGFMAACLRRLPRRPKTAGAAVAAPANRSLDEAPDQCRESDRSTSSSLPHPGLSPTAQRISAQIRATLRRRQKKHFTLH